MNIQYTIIKDNTNERLNNYNENVTGEIHYIQQINKKNDK